jgi:hypothetical protein
MIKIVAIISFFLSLLFVTISFGQNDDPLEKGFYDSPSSLSRIEGSLDKLIEIGKEGVDNARELVDLQTKQAVLEERTLENQRKIDKHSDILQQITGVLSECVQKLNTQERSHDLWVNIVIGLFMSGVSIFGTFHFIEKRKMNKNNN